MGKKSSRTVVLERINEVLEIRLAGATAADIVRYGAQKGWQVERRQTQKYIHRADQAIAASLEKNRAVNLTWHLAARRHLYYRTVQCADYATAGRLLKDEAELHGLYPPRRLEHEGKRGGPIRVRVAKELTNEQLVRIYSPDEPPPGAP